MNHGGRTHEEDPMPAPQVRLELIDATELAEALVVAYVAGAPWPSSVSAASGVADRTL